MKSNTPDFVPGEKLYEELLMDEEGLQDTENKMIHIGKPIDMDEEKFMHQLIKLRDAANDDSDAIRAMVSKVRSDFDHD